MVDDVLAMFYEVSVWPGREHSRTTALVSEVDDSRPTYRFLKLVSGALKYLLLAAVVACWIAGTAFAFSHPFLDARLIWVYFACVVALLVLFLHALWRRRWKQLAILCAILAVVFLPYYDAPPPFKWLYVRAFRIHASPLEDYLARCRLIAFVENGVEQKLGRCESFGTAGDVTVCIFYDTSGEFVLPVSQRTPEWRAAMSHFSPRAVLLAKENRASYLMEHFYEIDIHVDEFDGDDERR
jgi:hypothetical protein